MRHGIAIPQRDANEMLEFLRTSRDDADNEPPAWVEWDTESDSESSESSVQHESSGSSDSSDDEYLPFMNLPANPDGKKCRCGSTTHMTVNSFACPLNPRNVAANAATARDDAAVVHDDDVSDSDDGDDDAAESDDDDDAATVRDDDAAADGDTAESDDDDDDAAVDGDAAEDNDDATASETRPVRRRRRLGLPTRRRRQLVPNNPDHPPSRRPRIENDASESEVQIDVGTNVKSPGTRWKLPATTIFTGKVVSKRLFRGVLRFEVRWQDGVVEYLKQEHIVPLLC